MSDLAYRFCSEIDGYKAGDLVCRFEVWLRIRRIPADVMRLEVLAFREVLDDAAVNAP